MAKVPATDAKLTYFGRWQTKGVKKLGNWNRPYVKFNFTGTTLMARFDGPVSVDVNIDGEEFVLAQQDGLVTIKSGLSEGTHSASITIRAADGTTGIESFFVDKGASIFEYIADSDVKHIQFIGDSITTDGRSYSYTIPKQYGHDYSIISMSSIALQDGSGWYNSSQIDRACLVGMESAYFDVKSPKDNCYYQIDGKTYGYSNPAATDWADNKPDVIVINLGTNDNYWINSGTAGIDAANFKQSYIEFVTKLANAFTDADIYILRTFNNLDSKYVSDFTLMRNATYEAYTQLQTTFGQRIKWVDTSSWDIEINAETVDTTGMTETEIKALDWTHPSATGYADLRDLVYNAISTSL